MARLAWLAAATADLDGIAAYIAEQSPEFAPLFVRRVVRATERLNAFPRLERVVPEFSRPTLRELIFMDYRIIYSIEHEGVVIVGVLHGAVDVSELGEARGWNLT